VFAVVVVEFCGACNFPSSTTKQTERDKPATSYVEAKYRQQVEILNKRAIAVSFPSIARFFSPQSCKVEKIVLIELVNESAIS